MKHAVGKVTRFHMQKLSIEVDGACNKHLFADFLRFNFVFHLNCYTIRDRNGIERS